MTTINLDSSSIKKAVIRSQHCQRNWDIEQKIPEEDIDVLEHAVRNCPSKQNVGFYNAYFIQDRETIEAIHEQTNGFVLNPVTGESTTNTQTLANLLVVLTKRDLNEWKEEDEHRNVQLDSWKSTDETDSEAIQILERDTQVAVGVAAGYLNVIASMLGYSTGCCQCFWPEGIQEILGTDEEPLLLMGIGFADKSRPRREHHKDPSITFPTKKKVEIKVKHI